jgi:hypothetical protein
MTDQKTIKINRVLPARVPADPNVDGSTVYWAKGIMVLTWS